MRLSFFKRSKGRILRQWTSSGASAKRVRRFQKRVRSRMKRGLSW